MGQEEGLFTLVSSSSKGSEEDAESVDKLFHNDSTSAGFIFEMPKNIEQWVNGI